MKIGFVSLGCPKNLVDSEVMMGLSQEGGHTLTPNPAEADVIVINTCAFIDSAKEESVNTILELAEFKKTGNCKRLVVTGCLGERYRDELKSADPGDRCSARHRRSAGDRRSHGGRRQKSDGFR